MSDESDPLRDLGKQLPYDRPDPARRDAVRSSLLVAASEGRRPGARSRWLLVGGGFAAGALAAAAIAMIVVRTPAPTAPAAREAVATIESSSAAELQRSTVTTPTGSDELVRVRSGTIRLAMPTVRTGDHVRLQTGDAEVEGSGAYEVVVAADALASVTVSTGTATVRLKGQQQAVFLAAGETWRPTVITAELEVPPAKPDVVATAAVDPASPTAASLSAASPSSSSSSSPSRVAASSSPSPTAASPSRTTVTPSSLPATRPRVVTPSSATTSPPQVVAPVEAATAPRPAVTAPIEPTPPVVTGTSPTESSFRAGYALLRDNKFAAAALELGKAADGAGPLAADARYFQAVALTKAGRAADAERALVQFIDRAATSVRRGRAVVMLARLLAARGDAASARAWFEDALRDADASVVAAARAGITALN